MDNNKIRYVIWGAIGIALVGIVIIWFLSRGGEEDAPPDIIRTTDPDTGDEIINVPGKTPEFNPNPGPTIFGGSKLIDSTPITIAQYQLVEFVMVDYARVNVGLDVTAVKFLPETIKATASTPSGIPYQYKLQVKTEGPVAMLDVTINLAGLDRVRVFINYPEKPNLGTFDSGYLPEQEPHEDQHDEGDI